MLLSFFLQKELGQWLQIYPSRRIQGGPERGHSEKVDIEIPCFPGPRAEPTKLLGEVLDIPFRQNAIEKLEGRAGTTDGHPKIMEELLIPIPGNPLLIGQQTSKQLTVDSSSSYLPRLAGPEFQAEGGREVPGRFPGRVADGIGL